MPMALNVAPAGHGSFHFSRDLLSFFVAVRLQLGLPRKMDGNLWLYGSEGRLYPMHHHPDLEFNLVTQGTGLYRLAARTYRIRRGDLLWLFPAQDHALIEFSLDFEMWIGVFKPGAVRRITADAGASVLGSAD